MRKKVNIMTMHILVHKKKIYWKKRRICTETGICRCIQNANTLFAPYCESKHPHSRSRAGAVLYTDKGNAWGISSGS